MCFAFCNICTFRTTCSNHDVSSPCQEVQLPSEVKQLTVQCPDCVVEEISSLKGTYRHIVFSILKALKDYGEY